MDTLFMQSLFSILIFIAVALIVFSPLVALILAAKAILSKFNNRRSNSRNGRN